MLCFFVVLRGPGGPGGITNRRGMKKLAGDLIFVRFGWSYEGFMPIFDESLGYAYSFGFKQFSIKSAFEPITPPPKVGSGGCGLQS